MFGKMITVEMVEIEEFPECDDNDYGTVVSAERFYIIHITRYS